MMNPIRKSIEVSWWDDGGASALAARSERLVSHPAPSGSILRRRGASASIQREAEPLNLSFPLRPCPLHRHSRMWAMSIFLMVASPLVRAQVTNTVTRSETNYSTRLDYSSFKIIADRNIFNSTRSGRSARTDGEPQKQTKVDAFSLVGTMTYEKGRFAFFDGTSSEYKKVLKSDGAIAGYKITDIAPAHVKLGLDGKEIELRVGMQMRRQDEGEWQQVAQTGSYAGSGRSTAASKVDSSTSAESGSGGEESDVLKRLLQKREAEENK